MDAAFKENIAAMHDASHAMDVIIIVTSNERQCNEWESRIKKAFPYVQEVIAVCEDWPGGAGNGLGTLYAFKKAEEKINRHSLLDMLSKGASIFLYHTAGIGKRLWPLTGVHHGDKSAIIIPSPENTTLLEQIIIQSSIFSKRNAGRLSVFWGDQLFIPAAPINEKPQSHVEIIGRRISTVDRANWERKKLKDYGLLLYNTESECVLLDKIDYDSYQQTLKRCREHKNTATSLGSFSISSTFLQDLLDEFSEEIALKKGKLDTDPHFWMPLILDEDAYIKYCPPTVDAKKLHQRFERFRQQKHSQLTICDIGEKSCWWDFGSLKHYFHNMQKLTAMNREGVVLRHFLKLNPYFDTKRNIVLNSELTDNKMRCSVLFDVYAEKAEGADSVLINCQAHSIKANMALGYSNKELTEIDLNNHHVRSEIAIDGHAIAFVTTIERNSKEDWDIKLQHNSHSYSEAFDLIKKEYS